jgi:hypothetical protein
MTKKSTTLRIATEHILKNFFESSDFIYPLDGSRESLIESMAKNPRGMIVHDEFANLMSWLDRDYNAGLISILTTLYNSINYTKKIKSDSEPKIINCPFINIASCSTIDWFNKHIKEDMLAGGFLPRFILVIEKSGGKLLPETPPPDESLKNQIISQLQAIAVAYQEETPMGYDKAAKKIYHDWYMDFFTRAKNIPAPTPSFYSRRVTDLHKFAMLNCAMRGGREMNTEDLDRAVATVEQLCCYVDEFIGSELALTIPQRDRKKVLDIIASLSGQNGGAAHWEVLKKSKLTARDFNNVIQTLVDEKTIEPNQEKRMDKRGSQMFYILSPETTSHEHQHR